MTNMKKLMTVFTAVLLIVSQASIFVEAEQNQDVADALFNVLEGTRTEIDELFDDVTQTDLVPDDALESYEEAQLLWDEAVSNYDDGDYEEAADKAKDALNKFGEAAYEVVESDEHENDEIDDEIEDAIETYVDLEKIMNRIAKLGEILADLMDRGVDVSTIILELDEVNSYVVEAEALLDVGDFESAEDVIEFIEDALDEIKEEIEMASEPLTQLKTEEFIRDSRDRVSSLEGTVVQLLSSYGATDEEIALIVNSFQDIVLRLDTLDIDDEDLDDVIDELEDLVEDTEDILEDEDDFDDDIVEAVLDIDKLVFKLGEYRQLMEELGETGFEVESYMTMIVEAEGILDEVFIDLESGYSDVVDDKLEDVEEILDSFEDLFDEIDDDDDSVDDHGDEETDDDSVGDHEDEDDSDDEDDESSDDSTPSSDEESDEIEESEIDFDAAKIDLQDMILLYKAEIDVLVDEGEDVSELEDLMANVEASLEDAVDFEDLDVVEERLEEVESILMDDFDVVFDDEPDSDSDD